VKRTTKKEREKWKTEEAAAREQLSKWISAKSQLSLYYPGPFFAAVVAGNLMRNPSDPNKLEFCAVETPFRVSISLNRCACY